MKLIKSNWLALLMALGLPALPRLWVEVGHPDYIYDREDDPVQWLIQLHFDGLISAGFVVLVFVYWWVENDRGPLPLVFKFAHVLLTALAAASFELLFFWFHYENAYSDYDRTSLHPIYPMVRFFKRQIGWTMWYFVAVQCCFVIGLILLTRRRASVRDAVSSHILDKDL